MKEYKVVVMGSGGVGKTALIVQYVSDQFIEKYDPTIEDFYRKEVNVDGAPAVIEILDTAGTEQFTAMRERYIENGQGFMLVYSIVNQSTFLDVRPLRDVIIQVKGGDSSPILLVGNKCDMEGERVVTTQQGEKLAEGWGCPFLEVSAKTKYNVKEVFEELPKRIKEEIPKRIKPLEENRGCCVCL